MHAFSLTLKTQGYNTVTVECVLQTIFWWKLNKHRTFCTNLNPGIARKFIQAFYICLGQSLCLKPNIAQKAASE